ncbi:trypsin [Actinomadura pelletieri DSM 43383]|uniref:Trypsin n=1 Tax=Actinomadura pelletieri DSM 43383 TaxID=1120940 RepID=A0A495QII6_9ACTN|nr:serine protease [Actinomadura pelletieri]RKS71846.1 trypsin [Actinomadura pelletieri DSM 43383]
MHNLRFALLAWAVTLLGLGLGTPAALAGPEPGGGPSTMIIGGRDATEPYPFMASLQSDEVGHFCGGSLIDPEWVVTAFHCVDFGTEPEDVRLRIGSPHKSEGGSLRGAERIVLHPEGDPSYFDIALIQLDEPVSYAPVALDVRPPTGTRVRMLGWGCTAPKRDVDRCPSDMPETLQQLDSTVHQVAECVNVRAPIEKNTELCAGNPAGDTDVGGPCFGDSGGPLLRRTATGWRLLGAFSRVEIPRDSHIADCSTGLGIYTDVTVHREWLESVMSGS